MRPVQKTLVDFDKIEAYARTVEFLHNKQAATDLRNVKKDILAVYDKQASNYCALVTCFDDKTTTVSVVPRDCWL